VCTNEGIFGVGLFNGIVKICPTPTQLVVFDYKIGYNLACIRDTAITGSGHNSASIRDTAKNLPPNRGFSRMGNLMVPFKF